MTEFKDFDESDKKNIVEFLAACSKGVSPTPDAPCIINMSYKAKQYVCKSIEAIMKGKQG